MQRALKSWIAAKRDEEMQLMKMSPSLDASSQIIKTLLKNVSNYLLIWNSFDSTRCSGDLITRPKEEPFQSAEQIQPFTSLKKGYLANLLHSESSNPKPMVANGTSNRMLGSSREKSLGSQNLDLQVTFRTTLTTFRKRQVSGWKSVYARSNRARA